MILINYLKPNIVIYADKLISGGISVYNENEEIIIKQKIVDQSIINIPMKFTNMNRIKVVFRTNKEIIKKTFTLIK